MRITVFGGSEPRPGDAAYEAAYQLGRLIGADHHTVLTGGYIGTMEAVSRGVAEAGGHVIGVTCAEIEAWRPGGPNRWVQEEVRFETLRERLYSLIDQCDAALVLPGGIGTLAELAAMWSHREHFPPSIDPDRSRMARCSGGFLSSFRCLCPRGSSKFVVFCCGHLPGVCHVNHPWRINQSSHARR